MVVKALYVIFIGMLIALLVGVGISAFYPSPKTPEERGIISRPEPVKPYPPEATESAEAYQQQLENEAAWREHSEAVEQYNIHVSIIALVSAVVILVVGLFTALRIPLISDGLLLGSALTLLYSVGRSFGGDNSKVQFFIIAVGLLISLAVGYWKFVRGKMPQS